LWIRIFLTQLYLPDSDESNLVPGSRLSAGEVRN
jgi:hypothetical protein